MRIGSREPPPLPAEERLRQPREQRLHAARHVRERGVGEQVAP